MRAGVRVVVVRVVGGHRDGRVRVLVLHLGEVVFDELVACAVRVRAWWPPRYSPKNV